MISKKKGLRQEGVEKHADPGGRGEGGEEGAEPQMDLDTGTSTGTTVDRLAAGEKEEKVKKYA